MDISFIVVQILGVVTLVLAVIMLQQKKKEKLLLMMSFVFILFAIQYFLRGQYMGLAAAIIIVVRNLTFYYFQKKNLNPSVVVLVVFQIIIVVSAFFTWQNLWSLLAFIAVAVPTWGVWQNNMAHTRKTLLLGKVLFLIYNFNAMMFTGMITNSFEIASAVTAMWRYDRKKIK